MLVPIARDLVVRGEALDVGYYVAVRTSQPVTMFGADTVRVTGVLQAGDDQGGSLVLRLQLLASNDLARWHVVWDEFLPAAAAAPVAFSVPSYGQPAPSFGQYVMARWILYPFNGLEPLTDQGWFLVSADLSTSLDPNV